MNSSKYPFPIKNPKALILAPDFELVNGKNILEIISLRSYYQNIVSIHYTHHRSIQDSL